MISDDLSERAARVGAPVEELAGPGEYAFGSTDPYRPCRAPFLCRATYDKPTRSITCECPWTPDGPTDYPAPEDTP